MNDGMTDLLRSELARLYADSSKHSSYQSIPKFIADQIGYQVEIDRQWRGDAVRLDLIEERLAGVDGKRWCDFGANTGFFTLSLAHSYPSLQLTAIEANRNHAAFIQQLASVAQLKNIRVVGRHIGIAELEEVPRQDVLLHLNVLHHAGSDFDSNKVACTDDFPAYAKDYLSLLRATTSVLVFQMGTNLWGDKGRPVVDFKDDARKYDFLTELLASSGWTVRDVAYAVRDDADQIRYRLIDSPSELPSLCLDRHVGEFYRRPIFICTS